MKEHYAGDAVPRSLPALFPLALMIGLVGCQQVHYRTHDFDWSGAKSKKGVPFVVGTSGSWHQEDSAGFHIERNMAPFWVGVDFGPVSPGTMEVISVSFVGMESGSVVSPEFSAAVPLEDGSGRLSVRAAEVQLRREDYEVRLHVRSVRDEGVRDEHLTGTLRQTFEQSRALRVWEKLMSV